MMGTHGIHFNFIRRQLTSARQQSLIFVLCVALALVTLVGLNSLNVSVNRAVLRDARQLLAADIVIDSRYEFSAPLREEVGRLEQEGALESTQIVSLFTVARALNEEASLLSELKVVEAAYPFYGTVQLASGRDLHDVLTPGHVIVEQLVLDRLGLAVGDRLRIGAAMLTIADVLVSEPDRPVNVFALGPRILVARADLESLDLIQPGSRVEYDWLFKVNDPAALEGVAAELAAAADPVQEDVETYRSNSTDLQQLFDDLFFFLNLVAIFTLLLAGIGIQSALTAFLRERDETVAIAKTVGATSRFVTVHFLWVIAILGVTGTLLGLAGGVALQWLFPRLLADFLPPDVQVRLSARVLVESLLLSGVVVASFTFLPLERLEKLRPSFIFRKEIAPTPRGPAFYGVLLLIVLFFSGMVLWQLDNWRRGLYFIGSVLGLLLITALLTEGLLRLLRRQSIRALAVRQALRGLFRPRNATRSIVITLTAALAVIFTIYLVERNLDAAFVRSYPADAPNLFFIDIQPDQRDAFAAALGVEAEYFPIVRATVAAVNGEPIAREEEEDGDGDEDSLARNFTLTYRNELLPDERLVRGDSLFDDTVAGAQVSVQGDLLDANRVQMGDVISFRIQGVPLDATVTSVRTLTEDSFRPQFTFVLPPADLHNAPQTTFAGARVPSAEIAALQNRMVAQFPNISVINVTEAVAAFADVARRLSRIIRFLTLFSIAAGLLIIISSVYATRFARMQEAVYFKIAGATSRFVLRVFTLENLLLGLISATLALCLAQLGSWILARFVFEIRYQPFVGTTLLLAIATVGLVTLVGMAASIPVLRQRPIRFLREQTQE